MWVSLGDDMVGNTTASLSDTRCVLDWVTSHMPQESKCSSTRNTFHNLRDDNYLVQLYFLLHLIQGNVWGTGKGIKFTREHFRGDKIETKNWLLLLARIAINRFDKISILLLPPAQGWGPRTDTVHKVSSCEQRRNNNRRVTDGPQTAHSTWVAELSLKPCWFQICWLFPLRDTWSFLRVKLKITLHLELLMHKWQSMTTGKITDQLSCKCLVTQMWFC